MPREIGLSLCECRLPQPIRGRKDLFSGAIYWNATVLLPAEAARTASTLLCETKLEFSVIIYHTTNSTILIGP
jgi:hypothetical protein